MTKIKEFFKVKRNIAISSITLLAIVAIASVAVFMITKKPPTNEIIPTVAKSSCEETSSQNVVTIPEIVETSSTAPVSSKETLELKVDGGLTQEEQTKFNDDFVENYHCDKCNGDFYTCKCTTGNMG